MEIRILNINELDIDEISGCVSKARLEKASKIKSEVDRARSIAVEYLLNSMLDELHSQVSTPVNLEYDRYGKPHVYCGSGAGSEIFFSLSHSGDYVACAISDKACGIDIEKHSDKRDYEKIAKRICTENELSRISSSKSFYNVWTLKESVLKAVGLGLSLDMKSFEFESAEGDVVTMVDGINYKGRSIDAPSGYSLSYVEAI